MLSVTEALEALSIGGWPDNLTLTTANALDANADYLDIVVHTDVPRVDGARRDPDGVRRLLASYARNVATKREPANNRSRSGETTWRDHPARLPARARTALLDRGSAELEATTALANTTCARPKTHLFLSRSQISDRDRPRGHFPARLRRLITMPKLQAFHADLYRTTCLDRLCLAQASWPR